MENIPTFQDISSKFEQEIILGERIINLNIYWNSRAEAWYMDIIDDEDSLIGIKIVPGWLLLRQFKSFLPNFIGDLIVLKLDQEAENYLTYDNLNNGWDLFYATVSEAEFWEDKYGLG